MKKTKVKKPKVKLVGEDGNAFAIIARVRKALREVDESKVREFTERATKSGSYSAMLAVCEEYVEIT